LADVAHHGQLAPLLKHLIALLEARPGAVQAVTLDRGNLKRYRDAVDPLMRSLGSLTDGPLGAVFARPTTERLRLDAPAVCVDVSASPPGTCSSKPPLCWPAGQPGSARWKQRTPSPTPEPAPQRRFLVVPDELWRVLRAGEGLVDRVDELSRLNRAQGVGQCLITHSLADLAALRSQDDRAKARGLFERCGALVVGGLPRQELAALAGDVPFTTAEADLVTSWSMPPGWSAAAEPPGRGRFLLKVGQRPGVPFRTELTAAETASGVHDTNSRWTARRAGAGELAAAWAVPVLALLAAIATGALWAGAGLVSLATGNGWPAVALTPSLLVDLARSGGPAGLWPALDPTVVVAAAVVLAVLLLAPAALVGRRLWRHRPAGPARSLARRGDVAPMLAAPAAAKARALRPTLASRGI